MKNKIKTNTVKQILAKVMLVIFIAVSLVNLSACRDPNCIKGDFHTSSNTMELDMVLKVVAKTKYFDLDNVTFDLYIGLQQIKNFSLTNQIDNISKYNLQEVDKEAKEGYYVVAITTDDVYYAYNKYSDFYQYIYENMTILKEISFKDKEKFPYTEKMSGTNISYSESITVSKDLIKKDVGEGGEIILILGEVYEIEERYFIDYSMMARVELGYIIEQDNIIRISFNSHEKI